MKYYKIFVGGDLSGIQKFLYNITSHKAAVSLKGRSAFLSLYLREIFDELKGKIEREGFSFEPLYCSGGKFYFITANDPIVENIINVVSKERLKKLWEDHFGQLCLSICYVAFNETKEGKDVTYTVEGHEDESSKTSGVLWKYVNGEFARQKNQKYKNLLVEQYEDFFEVQEVGGRSKVCAVTGIESPRCVSLIDQKYREDAEDKELFVLPSVKDQIELGQKLSREQNLVRKDSSGKEFYEIKTFSDYAGDTYLGILMMDVDGLGKRFIKGFKTLEDYKKFSGKVTEFFEKTVPGKLAEPFKEHINVIYAGGDDLFIIGRWDKLVEFAEVIHGETEKTFMEDSYNDNGENQRISVSGGIAVVRPKFPISKGAELAKEAEGASKNIPGKNAFTIFGKTIRWNREFEEVKELKNEFVKFISNSEMKFGKSILFKMMLYSNMADRNFDKPEKEKDYQYMWHSAYFLSRFMEDFKKETVFDPTCERLKFCKKLRNEYTMEPKLKLAAVAARWAELLIRE